MPTFHPGGIHPPQYKITAHSPIIDVELPREVVMTFLQHIGAPARCRVSKGDHVCRGDLVAAAGGPVSANVHTPISGTVTKIDKVRNPQGIDVDAVTIVANDSDHITDVAFMLSKEPVRSSSDIAALSPREIIAIVDETGIVGLGGATFPTRVKLSPPPGAHADTLIINGAECEPYLTNDHALMLTSPCEVVEGAELLRRAVGVSRAIIGVEENKRDAVEALTNAAAKYNDIDVIALSVKYPQGGEKQLIQALTGREVPSGALPISVGVVVQNVATAFAVYEAVKYGTPLIDRIVTVTGPSVVSPGNFRVPFGFSMRALVDLAGGVPSDTGKIILGGPMMGRVAVNIDAPVTKGVSGILMLPADESHRGRVEPCIRCAACVEACPMGLEPYRISTLSRFGEWEMAEDNKVMNCIECGSCSYVCPSSRPILDFIRLGKSNVGAIIRARGK